MKQKIQTKFMNEDGQTAQANFVTYLGDDNIWFADLLYEIKREWIDKKHYVTDIIIREKEPVMLAVNKPHVPFISADKEKNKQYLNLPKDKIETITKKLNASLPKDGKTDEIMEFSFRVEGLGAFRGNFSTDNAGAGISIRYLPSDMISIKKVGYPNKYMKKIVDMVSEVSISTPAGIRKTSAVKKAGLIIHCGPTGSGKTTAAAAEIGYFAEYQTGTIITYEDPIEIEFPVTTAPVRQYELGKDIVADEHETIIQKIKKHVVRNNPSVIQFGEVRTPEEIRLAIDTSLRGHLVIATLHAADVGEALSTLMSVTKDEEYLLSQALLSIVAHRLVTTQMGKILPLYEYISLTPQDRAAIKQKRVEDVVKLLSGKDNEHKDGCSFAQYLDMQAKEGKLSAQEAQEIEETIINDK